MDHTACGESSGTGGSEFQETLAMSNAENPHFSSQQQIPSLNCQTTTWAEPNGQHNHNGTELSLVMHPSNQLFAEPFFSPPPLKTTNTPSPTSPGI